MEPSIIKKAEQRAVEYTTRLIRQQSYSGEEQGVVEELAAIMREAGFSHVATDRYGSVVGTIEGAHPGQTILMDGHVDTVPVPDPSAWSQDPFGGHVVDGKLYGRGASDMKGAIAAMVAGAAAFVESCKGDFEGRICVAGVVQEEPFEGIAAREISEAYQPDVVIIGEASELNLNIGQRGRAEIVVTTEGVPAHSANPEKGVNAVMHMARLLTELEQGLVPNVHPVLGDGIAVCTDILSTPYPGASVVPSGCSATFDRRTLVGETKGGVLYPFTEQIERLQRSIPTLKATAAYSMGEFTCYTGEPIRAQRFFPAWLYDPSEWFVEEALVGLHEVGLDPELSHYSFCTNGSHYAGEANIPTIGFGPSPENLAHTIDEYVEVSQLHGAARGYAGILAGLLEGETA